MYSGGNPAFLSVRVLQLRRLGEGDNHTAQRQEVDSGTILALRFGIRTRGPSLHGRPGRLSKPIC